MIRKRLAPVVKKSDGYALTEQLEQLVADHEAALREHASRAEDRHAVVSQRLAQLEDEEAALVSLRDRLPA